MTGILDLSTIIKSLHPVLDDRVFTFAQLTSSHESELKSQIGSFLEEEGLTVICETKEAEAMELKHEGRFQMITLKVNSSLISVGLTAAVSQQLADLKIPCNIVAAFHHDHLFVPECRAQEALTALKELSATASSD